MAKKSGDSAEPQTRDTVKVTAVLAQNCTCECPPQQPFDKSAIRVSWPMPWRLRARGFTSVARDQEPGKLSCPQ